MLITDTKLAFLAGQYFAFVEAAGEAPRVRRESDAAVERARDVLYAELKPILRRQGYDEQTCTRVDIAAGIGPDGRFALTLSWHRNPAFAQSGEVIPTAAQGVPTPQWHPSFVLYRRHGDGDEIPIEVSDPVLVLLLNVDGWLQSAKEDVQRLHARGNSGAQWRVLLQGIGRMDQRLGEALAEWAPPVPPTLKSLLATTDGMPTDFAPALQDPRNPRVAAYQLITNALLDAADDAERAGLRPKQRIARVHDGLRLQQRPIHSALQAAARRIDGSAAPDLAPLRWLPALERLDPTG